MAYDEGLAARIEHALSGEPGITALKMFGGLAFLVDGRLCCGVLGDRLLVRIDREITETILREPHVGPMDFTGKPMRGLVLVDSEGCAEDPELLEWVRRGVRYARTLTPRRSPRARREEP
jgi:TfoX/Sxy family transcriptional regulator of competence genes